VDTHFTNLYFYPIYSTSKLAIDVEIYRSDGTLAGQKKNALIVESPGQELRILKLKELLKELGIDKEENLSAKIMASALEGSRVPARIKLGLDLGNENIGLPCNICTNLQPYNPRLEGKRSSFKWAPLLADQPWPSLWLMNSSPEKVYSEIATADITFYRAKDTTGLTRQVTLPPHGFSVINVADDAELKAFFDGDIGWCTIVTTNPYLTTYYFSESSAGLIGGDHGF
jgi:hypothetical protein